MHIIDAYCGVGPWRLRDALLPYTPEEMLALMDHFGIAEALVYPNGAVGWGRPPAINDQVLKAKKLSPRFRPAYVVAPHEHEGYPTPATYLELMRQAGARAAWLQAGPVRGLWGWLLGDLLEPLIAYRVPVFLTVEQFGPDDIHRLLTDFPELRVVVCGLGYMEDTWLFTLLRRHAGLHACLGHFYVPPLGMERFVAKIDATRLIFGSGLPHFSPGGLIGQVMYADIADEDKQLILAGNISRLLAEVTL